MKPRKIVQVAGEDTEWEEYTHVDMPYVVVSGIPPREDESEKEEA